MKENLENNQTYVDYANKFKMNVNDCIKIIFNDDVSLFKKEAIWFAENGCGLNG